VTPNHQPNALSSPLRSRIPALVGIGTFVVLVGMLAPKLMTPMANSSADSTTPKTTGEDSTEQTTSPAEAAPLDVLRPIEQVVIGASVIIIVGLGGFWLFNRRRAASAMPGPAFLNITAALPLRQNCWAYLFEASGHQFLAGVDPTGIRSVLALPNTQPEPVEEPRGVAQPVLVPTIFPPPVLGGKR
jgi:hypothetical protein